MRDKYPFVAENQCVGEIFFGSEGYMIIPDYSSYYTFLGPKNEPGPFKTEADDARKDMPALLANGERAPLPELDRRDPQPQARGPQRRRRAGPPLGTVCHLAKISCKLGRSVHFDPKTERFVNDPEADKFLKREYRKPYVVPDVV